jgi:lipoate-protein ligase B
MTDRVLEVIEAGLLPYGAALAWQRDVARARIEGRLDHDVLLLVEHPPVLTTGRATRGGHILDSSGIEVVEVERGGDVTYHGPGQLVGYPIFDLKQHRPDLHWYLRTLEQALIDALATLEIPCERRPGYTGVWTRGRKIASIGVHVKQWVTWHGFALNVTTDLEQFARIVPCGIAGVEMTSVEREVGPEAGGALRERAVEAVIHACGQAFDLTARSSVATASPSWAHHSQTSTPSWDTSRSGSWG